MATISSLSRAEALKKADELPVRLPPGRAVRQTNLHDIAERGVGGRAQHALLQDSPDRRLGCGRTFRRVTALGLPFKPFWRSRLVIAPWLLVRKAGSTSIHPITPRGPGRPKLILRKYLRHDFASVNAAFAERGSGFL